MKKMMAIIINPPLGDGDRSKNRLRPTLFSQSTIYFITLALYRLATYHWKLSAFFFSSMGRKNCGEM